MTNREAKKLLTREERKEYKRYQREGLMNFYVKVQNNTWNAESYGYYKLVSFSKAMELVHGRLTVIGDLIERVKTSKHEWKVLER